MPGFRFDTHSVAHNIINMTPIPRELDLAGAGLEYREMDPFAVAFFADGRRVRFHRSIEQTVRAIAEIDRAEADAYAEFMQVAVPVVDLMIAGMQAGRIGARDDEAPRAPAAARPAGFVAVAGGASDVPRPQPRPARRPAPPAALPSHRTPVDGLYISGAGTAPVGGISGSPGRAAARALLADRGIGRRPG